MLTARKVATAEAGRYTDQKGLMLVVKPSGAKSWVLRYQRNGRRRDMGLGPYPEITHAAAREKALAARRQILDGIDPLDQVPEQKSTFREAAEDLIESKRPGWRNAKHAAQWTSTLATYAYPRLGKLDVRSIDAQQVLGVLKPIWPEKPETASRVRQRIEAVLDFAASRGLRQGENPARWRGHLQHLLAKPSSIRSVAHHAALDWRRMPEFMDALSSRGGASANALAFAILTAARSGEVRGMRWGEIDLDGKVWTVSAERMKGGKEHRVPLTDAAIRCLGAQGHANALVFPSPSRPDKPLSDMTLTAVIRKMAFGEITVHGFRSTFHDWARADHPSSRQSRFHPIC